MNLPKPDSRFVFPLMVSLLVILFAYSNYRAANMSMTIDESNSYIGFADTKVWTCLYSPDCWGSANNHLLNTFLFQGSIRLFGLSEWSIRLPNLLAHLLYMVSSLLLVRLIVPDALLRLTGFALLNLNPYFLDFFVVARGYGLAMGFLMFSIWCLYRYAAQPRIGWVAAVFSGLFLAVLSVFTSLICWFSLWGCLLLLQLLYGTEKKISTRHIIGTNLIPLTLTAGLAILLYRPIIWLQQAGEFNWGTSNLYDTFYYLVVESLYQQRYIGNDFVNKLIFQLVAGIIFCTGAWYLFRRLRREKTHIKTLYLMTAMTLLLLPLFIMIAQHFVLGSEFLVHRKSLLFLPPAGLVTLLTLRELSDQYGRRGKVLSLAVLLFSVIHLVRGARLESCYEWWFNENTEEVALFFNQKAEKNPSLKVGVNWIFYPSLRFYRDFLLPNNWQIESLRGEIKADSTIDYYYLFTAESSQLAGEYVLFDTVCAGVVLLEKEKIREGE